MIRMKKSLRRGFPFWYTLRSMREGPECSTFLQKEIVREIINGCFQEYPVSVKILNEYECIITMPKEMVTSIVAQNLQSMTHWGGLELISNVL